MAESLAEHVDRATRRMLVERGDRQQRGLARAVRAEHHPPFPRAHLPAHVVEHACAVEVEA